MSAADNGLLRRLISDHGLQPIMVPSTSPELVELGRSLFFDPELSGNRDVACATCHHPTTASADGRSLSSGVGGMGLGPDRSQDPQREVVPRNAPEIMHRGHEAWTSMFWDSRLEKVDGKLVSPAGPQLPSGLESPIVAQAMFPVTSRAEMRGVEGDRDVFGQVNELAQIADNDFTGIWSALTQRLMAIPAYQEAFRKAYPDVPSDEIGFEHAAQAIAEFEIAAFSPDDSAWDRYLAGDNSALTEAAKRGATHFYQGSCASCHSGTLMTNQRHHNIGVPQFGPGKDESHTDVGRALATQETADEFTFRTPPLRNVMLTGPWMHNGAFHSIEDVIRHKFDPAGSLAEYDWSQLPEHLLSTARTDVELLARLTAGLDHRLPIGETLSDSQVDDLMAFLFSLTSPSADLMLELTPDEVLSGLNPVSQEMLSPLQLLYDPADGSLTLTGESGLSLDALFLRIQDHDDPAGFEFAVGSAPWASDVDIVLRDEINAQSFLDYRTTPAMLLTAGDQIEGLLPSGLLAADMAEHFSAAMRLYGSPMLWSVPVAAVPEPRLTSWALLIWMLAVRRRWS